jgi:riboflavin kinase / FMN adenylyltransferase
VTAPSTVLRPSELPAIGPAAVTLGVFDGVHRGHRHLLDALRRAARAAGAQSVAILFEPHPDEVIRHTAVPRLAPTHVNAARIVDAGVDHALPLRFDESLRGLAPEEFLDALAPAIELRAFVMTPGSAFGRGRAGTVDRMRELAADRGCQVSTVEPLEADGEPVSSSRVRDALAAGDIGQATALLGRAPYLEGVVVHGDRRGRALGFPTANLAFAYTPALPALGIYLGRVAVPERGVGPAHSALVSVGIRPTFHPHGRVMVEVYLLDWDGDLYDATLQLEIDVRLREERRFERVEALVEQMRADEAEARRRISSGTKWAESGR